MSEQWRPVVGYENEYAVSDQGLVRSVDRAIGGRLYVGRLLKVSANHDGYLRFTARHSGERQQRSLFVHRVVLAAFIGSKPDGSVTRHLNGNTLDNRLSNLTYGTQSENNYDRVRHGTDPNAAKQQCISGHDYTPANTYIGPNGWRNCRECKRLKDRRRYAQKTGKLVSA